MIARTFVILAALVALPAASFVGASADAGENLVLNGSFEYGVGSFAEGWHSDGGGALARVRALDGPHGAYVGLVTGLPSGEAAAARSASFDASPGTALRLTLMLRDAATPLDVGFEFDTFSGPARVMLGDRLSSPDWTTIAFTAAVPADAFAASVVAVVRGETATALDNLKVVALGPTPPGGLVDEFDSLDAWTVEGDDSSLQCLFEDCHLVISPDCCADYQSVTRSVDGTSATRVSLDHRLLSTSGNSDTEFYLVADDVVVLVLRTTDGSAFANNGVSVSTAAGGETGVFHQLDANEWHRIGVELQGGMVTAFVADEDGSVLASSDPVPAGFVGFDAVKIIGVSWGDSQSFHWDRLSVE